MIYETFSDRETFDIGKKIAEGVCSGAVVCLDGDLGVGKTVFAKGFAAGLGISGIQAVQLAADSHEILFSLIPLVGIQINVLIADRSGDTVGHQRAHLTGLDEPIRTFVMERPETKEFLDRWRALLDCIMPGYVSEGKQQLAIAVGCTGGQHRSVALAAATGAYLKKRGYNVHVTHRDLFRAETRGASEASAGAGTDPGEVLEDGGREGDPR